MNTGSSAEATVEGVASRLASEQVIETTVRRIKRGRRLRVARASAVGMAIAVVVGAAGWGLVQFIDDVSEPAAPIVEIGAEPLELQLREAIESGDHTRMQALIDAGVNLDQELGWNVSFAAVAMQACDLEALRILDAAGASRAPSVIYPYDVAVLAAARHCDAATLDSALEGSDGSVSRRDIASAVASEGSLGLMSALVSRGYPLDDPSTGWSTLEDAAAGDRFDMVVLLLELGADPLIVDDGRSLAERLRASGAPQEVVDAASEAIAAAGGSS